MRQNQSNNASRRSNIHRTLARTGTSLMGGSYLLALLLVLTLVLGERFTQCQEQLNVESRQQKDNEDLSNTIKYLESMDKYLSQMSRPRFGRSESSSRQQQLGRAQQALAQQSLLTLQPASSAELYPTSPLADLLRAQLARKYTASY